MLTNIRDIFWILMYALWHCFCYLQPRHRLLYCFCWERANHAGFCELINYENRKVSVLWGAWMKCLKTISQCYILFWNFLWDVMHLKIKAVQWNFLNFISGTNSCLCEQILAISPHMCSSTVGDCHCSQSPLLLLGESQSKESRPNLLHISSLTAKGKCGLLR